jgi:predicted amidophosphoribosyltransferase
MNSSIKERLKRIASTARALPPRALIARTIKGLSNGGIELLFPGTCLSCNEELDSTECSVACVLLCDECLDELELFEGPVCRLCGAPVPKLPAPNAPEALDRPIGPAAAGCYSCRGRKLWFDRTIAAGLYDGLLRDLLLRMKQAAGDPLSLTVGRLIWHRQADELRALGVDVVAPIPLHWRRRLSHRTNSAALLAEVLAGELRAPLATGLLRRRRHTQPQFSLTPPQRWENMRQAFALRSGQHLDQAHVLLVDDILTTGATCSEAAKVLKKAGADRVTVVVAARAIT